MGYPTTRRRDGLKNMACSAIKRTGTSIEKDSERTSGGFVPKKCKVKYPTNDEPVHVEVN